MNNAVNDAAKFLKSTLRLPSSKFPPRPPPADVAKYLPRCTDDLYRWQRRERSSQKTFVLHDGPPYANGDLHAGHALNKIIKDIICRTKLAEGCRVDYVPGWDCHGLPIELKALEHHGWKRGQGVDPVSIRKAARGFAQKTVKKQMEAFRSWAVMGDWENHWKTMDKDFELRQLNVFRAMAEHGLIYRKHKPVYWSPSSGTALAEAELEYQEDHISTAALVKFPIQGSAFDSDTTTYALIWTTTPWTLPANQAIALHSDLQYIKVKSSRHGQMIIARPRLTYLEELIGESLTVVDENVDVDALLSSSYSGMSQFGEDAKNRPFIHADFVSAESGTGLVHCAPGHGMDDYDALQPLVKVGRVNVKAPVDNLGNFDATASPEKPDLLAGQFVFSDGNKTVLDMLYDAGLLVHKHAYKHKYPIDWRTKEPVIIRATAQWFADISSIKSDTLSALQAISFLPETGESRLKSFVDNRSEWCISRQRSWGVPIPALYHKESGEPILSAKSIDHIIQVIKTRGIDAWWSDPLDDPAWLMPGLSTADYVRGADTMDVWFDSGTSWSMLQDSESSQNQPLCDIYMEGSDQHRGWFQSSLLTNVAYQKSTHPDKQAHAPFQKLVTHGFTLDGQGKKMSKSLGNVIAPDQIIAGLESTTTAQQPKTSKKHKKIHPLGPDALRLWVASSDWTKDVVISETVVKTIHTALDKYRVTIKLLLGLLQDFKKEYLLPYHYLSTLDKIALLQLYHTSTGVKKSFTNLEFHRAMTAINRWVVADLSGFYFEAIKDIIYCDSPSSVRRRSVQTTLYYILSQLQQMLGVITPLLIEESWEHCTNDYKSAFDHPLKQMWETLPAEWSNSQIESLLDTIMAINSAVKSSQEKARADRLMGQSLASDVKIIVGENSSIVDISTSTWEEILVVSKVEYVQALKSKSGHEPIPNDTANWSYSQVVQGSSGDEIATVVVSNPVDQKCARCWKYQVKNDQQSISSEVKTERTLPLCERCIDVVECPL